MVAAPDRSGDGAQPHRLQRPPHELRDPGRQAERAARGVLRGQGRGRRGADRHRGALDPPDRLALREAHPRLPPRRHPRLPAHHRRRAPPPRADLRPDQPQRRPGLLDVHPPAGVGAVGRRRPAVPGGAQGRRRRRDRRDRRRLRPGRRALRRGRVRRHRAPVLPLLHRAGLPLARHEPAHRPLRRLAGEPRPPAARAGRRGAAGDRVGSGARRAHLRRRADRGRHHHRRGRAGRRAGGGQRSRRLHQHLDRRGHREPLHDRGVDAHPAGLRPVHPVGHPQGRRPPGDRGGALQGSPPGRAGAGRGALRPRGRGAGPDRRCRLRGQGPCRRGRGDQALPVVQPGVRGPDGAEPLARLHREPPHRPGVRAPGDARAHGASEAR